MLLDLDKVKEVIWEKALWRFILFECDLTAKLWKLVEGIYGAFPHGKKAGCLSFAMLLNKCAIR